MRYIKLSKKGFSSKRAIVDDNTYPIVDTLFQWSYRNDGYAVTNMWENDKRKLVTMHRYIYENWIGNIPKGMVIDHINGNRLDNRIENLRMVTQPENCRNRPYHRNGRIAISSQYKGVSFRRDVSKWQAYIRINHKQIGLGLFKTEEEAYKAILKILSSNC